MPRNPPAYTPKDLNLEGPGQRAGGAPHQWRGEIREGLWQRDLQSSHLKGKGVGEGPSSRPSEQPFRKARLVLGCVGNLRTAPLTADVVFVTVWIGPQSCFSCRMSGERLAVAGLQRRSSQEGSCRDDQKRWRAGLGKWAGTKGGSAAESCPGAEPRHHGDLCHRDRPVGVLQKEAQGADGRGRLDDGPAKVTNVHSALCMSVPLK